MLSKIPNLVIRIPKKDTSYTPINPYKIYIRGKFIISLNYNAVTTYYSKYRNHMMLDLCGPVLKIVFRGIKYIYIFLDTATK